MQNKPLSVFLSFIWGCIYGVFVGLSAYLVVYACLHAVGRKDLEEFAGYIGMACVPVWGIIKAWNTWDHLRLEEAHRKYNEYKESLKSRGGYPPGR